MHMNIELRSAAKKGDLAKVKEWIAAGADVNEKDADGITPLMEAKTSEIVKALIEAGADVDAKDRFGYTALKLSLLKEDCLEQMKLLLKAGADVNTTVDGDTVLMGAVRLSEHTKDPKPVKLLLKYGADLRAESMDGKRALDYAKTDEIKKLLINAQKKNRFKDAVNKFFPVRNIFNGGRKI